MSGRPLCACHGEPMTTVNNRPCGWRCTVNHRAAQLKYLDRRMEDPVFRLSERMRVASHQRRRTIERMKEAIS